MLRCIAHSRYTFRSSHSLLKGYRTRSKMGCRCYPQCDTKERRDAPPHRAPFLLVLLSNCPIPSGTSLARTLHWKDRFCWRFALHSLPSQSPYPRFGLTTTLMLGCRQGDRTERPFSCDSLRLLASCLPVLVLVWVGSHPRLGHQPQCNRLVHSAHTDTEAPAAHNEL